MVFLSIDSKSWLMKHGRFLSKDPQILRSLNPAPSRWKTPCFRVPGMISFETKLTWWPPVPPSSCGWSHQGMEKQSTVWILRMATNYNKYIYIWGIYIYIIYNLYMYIYICLCNIYIYNIYLLYCIYVQYLYIQLYVLFYWLIDIFHLFMYLVVFIFSQPTTFSQS